MHLRVKCFHACFLQTILFCLSAVTVALSVVDDGVGKILEENPHKLVDGAYSFNFDTDSRSRYQAGQSQGETRAFGRGGAGGRNMCKSHAIEKG